MTPEASSVLSKDIALCLSGGGYRAAAYHLGAMKTLHELGMLDRVKYISTASGGTITAMKYVVDVIKGRSFDEFFDDMSDFLVKVNVVRDAFEILEHTPCPAGKDDLSLIRSAAQVYRRDLIGSREDGDRFTEWTLRDFESAMRDKNGAFHDLIFNSSEFRTGNGFRFRVAPNRRVVFGNNPTRVKKEVWQQLSLADVVAATSCFPGVFEPIRFPEDFYMKDRSHAADPFANKNDLRTVALMDGGVLDNQGLHGMTVSYKKVPLPFDLLLISDTAAREDDILKYKIEERSGRISIDLVIAGVVGFLAVLLTASIATIMNLGREFDLSLARVFGLFVALISTVCSVAIIGLIIWGVHKLHQLPVMGAKFPIWSYIRRLTIHDLWSLISGRLFSVKAMTFQVFMKRIRSLQYEATENAVDEETSKNLFGDRMIGSSIYAMVPKKAPGPKVVSTSPKIPELVPTLSMRKNARKAEKVGTKLWLNRTELKHLIDCGRTTMCLSLLEYFWTSERFGDDPKPNDPESPFHSVYQRWVDFKTEFPDSSPATPKATVAEP